MSQEDFDKLLNENDERISDIYESNIQPDKLWNLCVEKMCRYFIEAEGTDHGAREIFTVPEWSDT